MKRAFLALAIAGALTMPATANAHPFNVPIPVGKGAISVFAWNVADKLSVSTSVAVYGCRHVQHNVGCEIEFDTDSGVTCTEPAIAYWAGRFAFRPRVYVDSSLLDCE